MHRLWTYRTYANTKKWGILCGILAPIIFFTSVLLAASLQDGYSHCTNYMSELGATGLHHAYVMKLGGFFITSIMLIIYSIIFPSTIEYKGKAKTIAFFTLLTHAIFLNGAGVFSCDLGCSPANPTPDQNLHDFFGAITIFILPISIMTWGYVFSKSSEEWTNKVKVFSYACGIIGLISYIAMMITDETRAGTGLFQRLSLGSSYFWVLVVSIMAYKNLDSPINATKGQSEP